MKKRATLWVLFTTMAFAVAALVFTPAGQAVADTMRPILVQVINDGNSPVPVTGTTSITGTADVNVVSLPAVQAQQSGSWNVGINGTPNVNVANLPTSTPVRGTLIATPEAGTGPVETMVLANALLTDILLEHNCTSGSSAFLRLSLVDTATGQTMIVLPLDGGITIINLTSGLQGPLTIRAETAGSPGEFCSLQLVWTGVQR